RERRPNREVDGRRRLSHRLDAQRVGRHRSLARRQDHRPRASFPGRIAHRASRVADAARRSRALRRGPRPARARAATKAGEPMTQTAAPGGASASVVLRLFIAVAAAFGCGISAAQTDDPAAPFLGTWSGVFTTTDHEFWKVEDFAC